MATKQEIAEAIRNSEERVMKTFSGLSEEQLNTRVHDDENDQWNARQVLAHLAGRAMGYERTLWAAECGAPPAAPGSFNVDDWNRERVSERIDKSVDDLLQEFKQVHDDMIARIEAMPQELLDKEVQRPQGMVKLGDALIGGCATHSINHTAVVERALGLPEPATA